MVRALVDAGKIAANDEEGIIKAILKREDLGSTGIGRGGGRTYEAGCPGLSGPWP